MNGIVEIQIISITISAIVNFLHEKKEFTVGQQSFRSFHSFYSALI